MEDQYKADRALFEQVEREERLDRLGVTKLSYANAKLRHYLNIIDQCLARRDLSASTILE